MWVFVCLALAAFGATAQAVDGEKIKREAEKEARSKSKEGCTELRSEGHAACLLAFTRSLDIDCFSAMTALEMAKKQADGKLFDVGDKAPAGTNARVADASCRVALKRIRRDREKNDAKMVAEKDTPPVCAELGALLQKDCFTPATMSDACQRTLSAMNMQQMSPTMKAQPLDAKCNSSLMLYRAYAKKPVAKKPGK